MFNSIICRPNRRFTSDKFTLFMASFNTLLKSIIYLRAGRMSENDSDFHGKVGGEVALAKIKKLID